MARYGRDFERGQRGMSGRNSSPRSSGFGQDRWQDDDRYGGTQNGYGGSGGMGSDGYGAGGGMGSDAYGNSYGEGYGTRGGRPGMYGGRGSLPEGYGQSDVGFGGGAYDNDFESGFGGGSGYGAGRQSGYAGGAQSRGGWRGYGAQQGGGSGRGSSYGGGYSTGYGGGSSRESFGGYGGGSFGSSGSSTSSYSSQSRQNEVLRMRASDLMTENPEVVTPDSSLADAARKMRDLNVGIIPVVENEQNRRLKGVITDRDIAIRAVAEGKDAKATKVMECMTTELETCNKNDSVGNVLSVMQREQVRRVPITDREGRLVGIIAQADVLTDIDSPQGVDRVADTLEEISEPARPRSRMGGRPGGGSSGRMSGGGTQRPSQSRGSEEEQSGGANASSSSRGGSSRSRQQNDEE